MRDRTQRVAYMADTKRAAAHTRPGPERGVAAYRRTPEREQTIHIGWPSDIGGRQRHINTQTIFKFPDRLFGRRECLRFIVHTHVAATGSINSKRITAKLARESFVSMCACTEPVRTDIGAVCVEYRRPKWPNTMLNHTHIPESHTCLSYTHIPSTE